LGVVQVSGMIYYTDLNDLAAAKPYLDAAIDAGPEANLPFVTAMLLALREGRIADAQEYARIILTQFPDPDLTNRAFSALYGDSSIAHEAMAGKYFAIGTNIVIGQYGDVIRITEEALAPVFADPAPPGLFGEINYGLSDVFLLQGFAYCNLHEYDAAENAYSQAIRFSDEYALAHLLRGQMRLKLLNNAGASADFDVWTAAAITGEWTCENLFESNLTR
jgi:tetratricopeptide (TPR) repeat protein